MASITLCCKKRLRPDGQKGRAIAVLRQVDETPVVLVGHSLGAYVAALLTAARPERVQTLVMIDPPPDVSDDHAEIAGRLAAHLDNLAAAPPHSVFESVAAAAEKLRAASPGLSHELAHALASRGTVETPEGVRWRWDPKLRTRSGLSLGGPLLSPAFRDQLKGGHVPIVLIRPSHGSPERSRGALPWEDLAERSHIVQGGHRLAEDAPEELARIIADSAAELAAAQMRPFY